MKTLRSLHREAPEWFQAMAACVAFSWLLAMAMAVSPRLHEHLHADAGHADHECVVTHLQTGSFGDGVPVVAVVVDFAPGAYLEPLALVKDVFLCPLCLENGLLVHGPPAVA